MKFNLKSLALALTITLSSSYAFADNEIVIYTNADEEAQLAIKNALNAHGYEGQYLMQSMGTSELGGKLIAEGKNIEADLITLSTYYLESLQKNQNLFKKIDFQVDPIEPLSSEYYMPMLGLTGSIFVNTEVLEADNLKAPTSIAELANEEYKGHISIPDITGSSTAWLLTQAAIEAYGNEKGAALISKIEENATDHLEMSGSAPLKKLRAGEAAIGFGLRHQAVADKKNGLPIDYIDPIEGNFQLREGVAIIDKGSNTNPKAMEMAKCIIKNARQELLQNYPVALYNGETIDPELIPSNPKQFSKPLTVELLKEHQALVKGTNN